MSLSLPSGLQCMSVAFSGHTRLLFDHLTSSMSNDVMKIGVDKCNYLQAWQALYSYVGWLKSYLINTSSLNVASVLT